MSPQAKATGVPGPLEDLSEVERLQPGDMVMAKLGIYPYWPATVALCFQAKYKNMYRVGSTPGKTKFWVQFFNENSGAFVHVGRIRIFKPDEALLYLVSPGSPYFDKQKHALDMAINDFYKLHPELSKAENGDPKKHSDILEPSLAAKGSGTPGPNLSESHAVKNVKKRKRASGVVPVVKKVELPKVLPKKVRRVAPVATDTEDDDTGDENKEFPTTDGKDEDWALRNRKSDVEQNGEERPKVLNRSEDNSKDTAEIQKLRRTVKKRDEELKDKDVIIAEMKAKIDKLRTKIDRAQERVRILLPVMPPDLPVKLPPRSKHATEEIDPSDFDDVVAKLELDFAMFEKECSKAQEADKALTEAARTAMATLQPLHNVLKGATESVLSSEQEVAKALKRLFSARISSSDLTSCNAGKVVNRIAKRTVANSKLLRGLAGALREVWITLLQDAGTENAPEQFSGSRKPGHHDADTHEHLKNQLRTSPPQTTASDGKNDSGAHVAASPKTRSEDIQNSASPDVREASDVEGNGNTLENGKGNAALSANKNGSEASEEAAGRESNLVPKHRSDNTPNDNVASAADSKVNLDRASSSSARSPLSRESDEG